MENSLEEYMDRAAAAMTPKDIAGAICMAMESTHVTRKAPDETISRRAFTNIIEQCDADRMVFLADDIAEFAKDETSVAARYREGDFSFAEKVRARYVVRLRECTVLATNLLANAESLRRQTGEWRFNRKDAAWPADAAEREALWRRKLGSALLGRSLSGRGGDAATEAIVRQRLGVLAAAEKRPPDPAGDTAAAIVSSYDAHSIYLSPKTADALQAPLNLSMCGIGTQWVVKDDAIIVTKTMEGGPVAKDGRIRPGDRLLSVSPKGDGDFTDIAGVSESDLVSMFHGAEGEPVSMEIVHRDGNCETVTVKRAKIEVKDFAASWKSVEARGARLGYLRLPSFYGPAESPDGSRHSSADDVRTALRELRKENVAGVLFDLRNCPGGSLDDAVKIIGYFTRGGPAVRMKGSLGEIVLPVLDAEVECDKPVVVLVNRESASAGELVPATLQDLGRAVIVGAERTVGKGTDQAMMGLLAPKGAALAITEGRFYRITGGSTQLKGVIPDIVLPCVANDALGEEGLKYPMEWNTIPPAPFEAAWDLGKFTPQLTERSAKRRAAKPAWKKQERLAKRSVERSRRKALPMDPAKRKAMRDGDNEVEDELERLEREGFDPAHREADPVLDEGLNILSDLVELNAGRVLPPLEKPAGAEPPDGLFDGLDDD